MENNEVPSNGEIERQFRVVRLMLDAHAFEKEWYFAIGISLQIALLVCSVFLCATTFASDEFYKWLGMQPEHGRFLRGSASVIAFALSLGLLLVDFKGKAALHGAAMDRWAQVNCEFRRVQPRSHEQWPEDSRKSLSESYWTASKGSVGISNRKWVMTS